LISFLIFKPHKNSAEIELREPSKRETTDERKKRKKDKEEGRGY